MNLTQLPDGVAQLESILLNSNDAIICYSNEGLITAWNPVCEKMFGYKEEEMIGKNMNIIIPEERQEEEADVILKVRNGEIFNAFETIRKDKNGKRLYLTINLIPVNDSTGRTIGMISFINEVSGSSRGIFYEQLQNIDIDKDRFIDLASHELKTPLTSLNGFLQLLSRNQMDEQNKYLINKAVQQVDKLSRLITELLDISRINSELLPINYSDFDFEDLLKDCVNVLQSSNTSHYIRIINNTDTTINADAIRLEQVMINLISNSIKYSPLNNEVLITVSGDDNIFHVEVKDFGIGIEESEHLKIFNRYYKEEKKKNFSGLGIGLYISKEIILRHAGNMWVESTPGKGATFIFEIPRHHSETI